MQRLGELVAERDQEQKKAGRPPAVVLFAYDAGLPQQAAQLFEQYGVCGKGFELLALFGRQRQYRSSGFCGSGKLLLAVVFQQVGELFEFVLQLFCG